MSEIITSISVTEGVSLVTIDNLSMNFDIVADIFTAMEGEQINVDMISQTTSCKNKTSLAFTIPDNEFTKAASVINRFKNNSNNIHIQISPSNAKLLVYGEEMKNSYGVAAKVFRELVSNDIQVKLITTSEDEISLLLDRENIDTAVENLSMAFEISI